MIELRWKTFRGTLCLLIILHSFTKSSVNYYLSLFFYIGVSLVSILFLLRQYRKATPAVRRQIVAAGIGAVAVATIIFVFIASR